MSLSFRAEQPGAAYNIEPNADLELLGVDGVEVTNPPDPVTETWITTPGTDVQTDASLQDECDAQWDSPGCGNAPYYLKWAKTVAPEITKIKVNEGFDERGESLGNITVVLATDTGPPSPDMVTAATTILGRKRPIGLLSFGVLGATEVQILVTAVVYVARESAAYYMAALDAARAIRQAQMQIAKSFYATDALALLHTPADVRNVELTWIYGDVSPVPEDSIGVLDVVGVTLVNV